MYKSFFELTKKPFQITTDPSFLWMGKKHKEALSTLKYGVIANTGFLLLTGDVGTGKTTLINRLVDDIKDRAYTAKIPDPGLSKYDFYRMVAQYFGMPIQVRTKSDFLEPFSRFLNDAHQEKKSVLLLIDEAQRLKHDLMEEIRLLSNLERQDAKLLNIFFVGQNEFNAILLQPENRALMRRITITYNIDPLDQTETCEYIRHRLKTAGAGYEIFSSAAMEEVYSFSNGYPRQINIICDLAMFFASQVAQRTISRKIVRQCRERLSFSVPAPPVETGKNIRAPAPVHYYRPHQTRRPRWYFLLRRAVLAALLLLLVGAVGYLLAPSSWKTDALVWMRSVLGREAPVVETTPETSTHILEPVDDGPPHRPPALRMPSSPPALVFSDTTTSDALSATANGDPLPHPADAAGPDTVDESDVSHPRPDPAAAIDWLLEKRRQQSD
jgi:general secretion pathway protein A